MCGITGWVDFSRDQTRERVVIDAMREAMETQYANVHRGLHWMSERTTDAYEACREAIAILLVMLRERDQVRIDDAVRAGHQHHLSRRTIQRAAHELRLRTVHRGRASGFWESP